MKEETRDTPGGDLDAVLGSSDAAVTVRTSKGNIGILPVTMGSLTRAARASGPLLDAFQAQEEADVLSLFLARGDELIDAVAHLSGTRVRFLESLPPNEFLDVLSAVIEVNMDFFVRLQPSVTGLLEKVRTLGHGQIRSNA